MQRSPPAQVSYTYEDLPHHDLYEILQRKIYKIRLAAIVPSVLFKHLAPLLRLHPLPQVAMSKKMERSGKKKKKVEDSDDQDYKKKVLLDYSTPGVVGNLGSVSEYAKAQKISVGRAKRELEKNLAYTLHKPRRQRGAFQPVLVFDKDEKWVADPKEVQLIAKQNKGYRHLLPVIDVLSKYAWVQSLKKKTGKDVTEAFRRVLTKPKGENLLNYKRMRVKNFTTERFYRDGRRKCLSYIEWFPLWASRPTR